MNPRTRRAALYAIGAIAILASANALAHSYAGLYDWAIHHRLSGWQARSWPAEIDVFLAVGELALYVAYLDDWPARRRWPLAATADSWRKDALASAIIGHASEVILRALTERAKQLGVGPAICAQLHSAADATSQGWPKWRAIAHNWDIASTGIHRGAGPTPVAAEFADLVLQIGRLAYHNQRWTPARAHASHTRDPADLAPVPGDITCVVTAVHTAADAVTRIAARDREAVRAAAAGHSLYVPAFTRTNAAVVRRRYRPASPSRIDEILASYDNAIEASARATSKLDNLALELGAPTWPLAALRAQPQNGLSPFRPGKMPISQGGANSPARPRGIGARARV